MKATLKLFERSWPCKAWDWEMKTKDVYLTSIRDDAYTTKGNAKRAALRCAERLGLVVSSEEVEA